MKSIEIVNLMHEIAEITAVLDEAHRGAKIIDLASVRERLADVRQQLKIWDECDPVDLGGI